MGGIWALLYVLGIVVPAVLAVGSTIAVVRLARPLHDASPPSRPAWQYVVIHLALGLGLALPLGPVAALAWLLVPGHLYLTRRPEPASGTKGRGGRFPLTSPTAVSRSWRLGWLFVLTGVFVPWLIGLGVKMYLDARGQPTLPIEGFIDPASVAIELLLTLTAWAFPFVALASAVVVPWRLAFASDDPARESVLPIWLAYAAGVLAAVPIFISVFWQFDTLMLLVPVGLLLLPPMALGYFIGWLVLRRRAPPSDLGSGLGR